ncbi:hypothetical protein l13_11990 [Neisseria weaveri ATCC 51223]|nr:hypothetical protein l13_11990 [Neisseria weaveri ATCC 51223]
MLSDGLNSNLHIFGFLFCSRYAGGGAMPAGSACVNNKPD